MLREKIKNIKVNDLKVFCVDSIQSTFCFIRDKLYMITVRVQTQIIEQKLGLNHNVI